jgi:hypothetical protein
METGMLCAYPGDVASNTWQALCPSSAAPQSHPFTPTTIQQQGGFCSPDSDWSQLTECSAKQGIPPNLQLAGTNPSQDAMFLTNQDSGYFPYNEVDVAATRMGKDSIIGFFVFDEGTQDAQWFSNMVTTFENDTKRKVPIVKFPSPNGSGSPPFNMSCLNCDSVANLGTYPSTTLHEMFLSSTQRVG